MAARTGQRGASASRGAYTGFSLCSASGAGPIPVPNWISSSSAATASLVTVSTTRPWRHSVTLAKSHPATAPTVNFSTCGITSLTSSDPNSCRASWAKLAIRVGPYACGPHTAPARERSSAAARRLTAARPRRRSPSAHRSACSAGCWLAGGEATPAGRPVPRRWSIHCSRARASRSRSSATRSRRSATSTRKSATLSRSSASFSRSAATKSPRSANHAFSSASRACVACRAAVARSLQLCGARCGP